MEQLVDVLDDPDIQNNLFFALADSCLVTGRPQSLLRVRHQGSTYGCYAMVVTSCMYGDEVLHVGHSTEGSPQELVDYSHCFRRPKSEENDSGPIEEPAEGYMASYKTAFNYAKEHGISPIDIYPWLGNGCRFRSYHGGEWDGKIEYPEGCRIHRDKKIFIGGYVHVKRHEINGRLDHQPVTGTIKMTRELFHWRGDEIYRGGNAIAVDVGARSMEALHAITLVGYGRAGVEDYFICQNSYGLGWGHRGYFKVRRDLVTHTYIPVGTRSPRSPGPPGEGNEAAVAGPEEAGGLEEIGNPIAKKQCI